MRVVCIIIAMFVMNACCTKMDCPCDRATITIKDATGNNDYRVVITDRQFSRQDSLNIFVDASYGYDVYDGMIPLLEKIEDHHFILTNKQTGAIDTISDITNVRVDSTFECNDCFLKKDIQHCEGITSKRLKYNGEVVDGYTVVVGN